jgi:hypothetical protein
MFAEEHPSEGNYFWLFAGSNLNVGFEDVVPAEPFAVPTLGAQLIEKGFSFKGYSQSLPKIGSTIHDGSAGLYARKHVPWVSFSNLPKRRHARDLIQLAPCRFPVRLRRAATAMQCDGVELRCDQEALRRAADGRRRRRLGEDAGGGRVIADPRAQRVGLLGAGFRQAIHRLDRTQQADMVQGRRVGVVRLHMRAGKDCRDPVASVSLGLVAARRHARVGQSQVAATVVAFVIGNDQEAVVRLSPIVVGAEVVPQPGVAKRDAGLRLAIVHVVFFVGDHEGDGRQLKTLAFAAGRM